MNEIKTDLINQARENYGQIYPCSRQSRLFDCFTTEGDQVMFWFNTEDNSTHIVIATLSK